MFSVHQGGLMNKGKLQPPRVMFLKIVLLIILSGISGAAVSAADDSMSVKSFQPPVEFDSKQMAVSELAVRHFDFIGEVFLVPSDGTRIVVYDTSFNMAPGVRARGIHQGMTVGLKFNNNREVVVVERLSNWDK